MQLDEIKHHPIVRIIHRTSWLGVAAILTLAVTTALSFLANRREDRAVLAIRDQMRLGREAYIYAVERDDLLRGLLIIPLPMGRIRDAALRDSMTAMLDSLDSALPRGSRGALLAGVARARILEWEQVFVDPVLGGAPPSPSADLIFFARVRATFAELGGVLGAASTRAVRAGDNLRLLSAAFILVQLAIILLAMRRAHRRLRVTACGVIESQNEIASRLGDAAEFRDYETSRHADRVGLLSGEIAKELGWDPYQIDLIRRAAPLHDLGKIGIPDDVLLKPDRLSEAEFRVMRSHTTIGAAILARAHSDIIQMAGEIALDHHERWDGGGYPLGKREHEIPLSARIVAVADIFDALTSDRPYHGAWSLDATLDELIRLRGSHLDPNVVDAFFRARGYDRTPPAEHYSSARGAVPPE